MPYFTPEERRARGLDVLRGINPPDTDVDAVALQLEDRLGALGSYTVDYLLGDVWTRPGLSPRNRSLVVLSALTTIPALSQLEKYVEAALNSGLSIEEIEEVMVQLSGYAGFARATEGLEAAHRAISRFQGTTLTPRPHAERKTDEDRMESFKAITATVFANQRNVGPAIDMGAFRGTAARFAYGEVWSRPQLSLHDRSLIVVTTLVSQNRRAEARIHLRSAFNHDVTAEELEELMVTVMVYVGFPTGVEGFEDLRAVESVES
jgi:4-carboxymuconolactone decarboxylase